MPMQEVADDVYCMSRGTFQDGCEEFVSNTSQKQNQKNAAMADFSLKKGMFTIIVF